MSSPKNSKAKIRANAKYTAKTYDLISVHTPKGKKAVIQEHASEFGESLSKFVNRAIDETIERDNQLLTRGDNA